MKSKKNVKKDVAKVGVYGQSKPFLGNGYSGGGGFYGGGTTPVPTTSVRG